MKLLTTLSLAALLAAAGTAADATNRGGGKLIVMNDSRDAVAVGGEMIAESQSATPFSASASILGLSGERAHAGSVVVNGCTCREKTIVLNKSRGALAIGAASAGSVEINSGFGF
jgi:hypothetical protein